MRHILYLALLTPGLLSAPSPALGSSEAGPPRFVVELEGGAVWQGKNDVQIPNSPEGTRFSLIDLQGFGPWPAARLYATWNINERHSLRGLAAPLSVTETGSIPIPIQFAGEVFQGGAPTEATYRFNSWRLTYAYRFHESARWNWRIGFTAKIRDAKIELKQNGMTAKKTDVGFVPLLHIRGAYHFAERWHFVLDADALAGGPGRAEDASFKLCADLNDRWSLSAGYRTLEGGADVDEVYNFAWLHYAVVSAAYRF